VVESMAHMFVYFSFRKSQHIVALVFRDPAAPFVFRRGACFRFLFNNGGVMRKLGKLIVASTSLLAISAANAADWQFTVAPALDFAFKKSDSVMTAGGAVWNAQWTGSPSYTSFVPSLAASYGPIYASISYDNPLAAWHGSSYDLVANTAADNIYSRKEAAMTLGYRLPWSVNAFLGYVHGRSDQTSMNIDGTAGTVTASDFTFDERGFYVGASYSRQFGDKGTLSASLAAGNMDGEMVLQTTNFGGERDVLTSKSPGYSLGVNWTGPLTGSMVYRTGLKVTNYNFNFDTLTVNGVNFPIPSDFYKLQETIYTFTIGIANYF